VTNRPADESDPQHGPEAASHGEETVELTIDALAQGGDGVGRDANGRVVFVPFTAPGDRVRARIVEARRRFARGRVATLLAAGPSRVEPPCGVFGECGGCAWQHVDYAAQVEAKRTLIRDALERIGHLAVPGPVEMVPCPAPYGYRIRTRVRVEGRRAGYRRRRSHALCPTRHCPILAPALERELPRLPARARRRRGDWWLAADAEGRAHAAPAGARAGRTPPFALRVGGRRLEVDPGGFTQSNGPLFETLAAAVGEAAGHGALAVELFAGAGYLTLGLAERFARVVAVEGDPRSAARLARNRDAAGLAGVEIVTAPVEEALRRPPLASLRPEVLVLDPPRTGLPGDAMRTLTDLSPARIVYLSCDPATLARDAAALSGAGWRLERVCGFDLFPQTPHVEVLCQLVAG